MWTSPDADDEGIADYLVDDPDTIDYFEICAICHSSLVSAEDVHQIGEGRCDACVLALYFGLCNLSLAVVKTICNHVFHPKCLADWRRVKDSCPVCRKWLNQEGYDDEDE